MFWMHGIRRVVVCEMKRGEGGEGGRRWGGGKKIPSPQAHQRQSRRGFVVGDVVVAVCNA